MNSGQPITPQHKPAQSLQEAGIASLIDEHEQAFFDDFAHFGIILNQYRLTETSWRIQEQSDVMIGSEGPAHGRRYHIFYNGFAIGDMDIGPSINISADLSSYYAETPYVACDITIDYPLALRHSAIRDFLFGVTSLACAGNKTEFEDNLSRITNAMLATLWDGVAMPEHATALNVRIVGTPRVYLDVSEKRNGAT